MFLAPGDPATLLVGGGKPPSPTVIAAIHREFHLDDPFLELYWRWLSGFLRGDLGRSLAYRDTVGHLLADRIGNTLLLAGYATLLILLAGVALGTLAALRGGRTGTLTTVFTSGTMAVPTFVAAVLLIWIFAVKLPWFPVYGSGDGLIDELRHLTLPAVALAFSWVAYVAQVTRGAVRAELRSEHVETARSRGVPESIVVRRHVLRNASGPIFAVSGVAVAGLVAGTAVVEQAFGIGGIGALLLDAAAKQDLSVVQAISLIMVGAFVCVNIVVDLVTAALDPRIAREGGS
jgi:peptide/nickel transport system permease protein